MVGLELLDFYSVFKKFIFQSVALAHAAWSFIDEEDVATDCYNNAAAGEDDDVDVVNPVVQESGAFVCLSLFFQRQPLARPSPCHGFFIHQKH